jgi:hypothetical protein
MPAELGIAGRRAHISIIGHSAPQGSPSAEAAADRFF